MQHIVTAPMVAVSVPLGAHTSQVRFLELGSVLPEGVDEVTLKHLLSVGMVVEVDAPQPVEEPTAEPAVPEAPALDAMTVEQLKAYLTERGIPFEGVTLKADLLALAQQ